jgi:hypothetical protein
VNLWAGQTYELGRQLPAGQLVRALAEEARAALQQAHERLGPPADAAAEKRTRASGAPE